MQKSTNTILETYELADQIDAIRADIKNLTSTVARMGQDRAIDTANQAEEAIRQNPLSSLAIAMALGFLFGFLTRR
jgi:ElaB/YqjD/DUF883 family membrane-anchored ribosome-binding protein